jgi:hypothetical protein
VDVTAGVDVTAAGAVATCVAATGMIAAGVAAAGVVVVGCAVVVAVTASLDTWTVGTVGMEARVGLPVAGVAIPVAVERSAWCAECPRA